MKAHKLGPSPPERHFRKERPRQIQEGIRIKKSSNAGIGNQERRSYPSSKPKSSSKRKAPARLSRNWKHGYGSDDDYAHCHMVSVETETDDAIKLGDEEEEELIPIV